MFILKNIIICVMLLSLVGCVTVTPDREPAVTQIENPVLEDITISGLIFRDERLAARMVGSSYSAGSRTAHVTVQSGSDQLS